MSRILVIGGAGYVGSSLVPHLVRRGHSVDVVDLLWFGNHLPPGVRVLCKDAMALRKEELSGYEQVVFLAGLSNDPMAEYSPAKNFISNAALPGYLAYVSKQAGVRRFVYGSTCSVYGYSKNGVGFDEDAPASCSYPYGISKLQGELAAMYLVDSDFSVIALRKGTVCGYSPRMRLDLVVNTMFKSALLTGELKVNNPEIWRPIVGIQDAIQAYTCALESDLSVDGVFNIVSQNYTIGELGTGVAQEIEHLLGLKVNVNMQQLPEYRSYKVKGEKAQQVLGFKAQESVESIVADLVENRAKFSDLQNPIYYNIEVFKSIDAGAPISSQPMVQK